MEKLQGFYSRALNTAKSVVEQFPLPWKPGPEEEEPAFRLSLVTGDRRGAGTNANIHVVIHDGAKRASRTLRPHHALKDDHERGATTHFHFGPDAGVWPPFEKVEVWRDNSGSLSLPFGLNKFVFGGDDKNSSDWFLDRIEIAFAAPPQGGGGARPPSPLHSTTTQPKPSQQPGGSPRTEPLTQSSSLPLNKTSEGEFRAWVFPVHRWVLEGRRYVIPLYDSLLPQDDREREEFRRKEIEAKREEYVYAEKVKGGPIQTEYLPDDENFSEQFFWTFVEKKASLMAVSRLINWTTPDWTSVDDSKQVFRMCLRPPHACEAWREDRWFGLQRLQGVEPTVVRLCEEVPRSVAIPACLPELLEGRSLEEAVTRRRIFMCNLAILKGLKCKADKQIAAPIALFYLNSSGELLPVLIQLQQELSHNNPVFTPLDAPNTWLTAKMFYNNAEAQFHQAISHLGFTHLLMEGVCAATHRSLSTSHPVSRLLAPHFLYLIAINKRGEEKLINAGGWVDSTMTQGTEGMFHLMAKWFLRWTYDRLNPVAEITDRGLIDPEVLPYYPYRDDAVDLYRVIRKYVHTIVARYYEPAASSRLSCDWELQNFRKELVSPFPAGLGLAGVPGTNHQGFTTIDEVVETLSGIISTCSIGHAAANSQQYDQYAFVPNYPGILNKDPPTEKLEYTESEIASLLPSKEVTLDIVVITNLLSTPITNRLGHFEVQYLYHPEDIHAADMFRSSLSLLSSLIADRNQQRRPEYNSLCPDSVPNSISI